MPSVEEMRSILALINEKARQVMALLHQASTDAGEIQGILAQTTSGSSQASIQEALAAYAQVQTGIDPLQSLVNVAMSAVDQYAANL